MPAQTYQTPYIFLETDYLPGDTAELRLPCDSVTVTDRDVIVEGAETRHVQALVWLPEYLSFDADGQQHRIKVGRPAVKPPLYVRFPRLDKGTAPL